MYNILKEAHSGWRYIVLLLLVITVVMAIMGVATKSAYTKTNKKMALFTLISAHIQLLLGLAVYFAGRWYGTDSGTKLGRYFKFEHLGMMVVAIILITIGNARSKKVGMGLNATNDTYAVSLGKHKAILIFFGLALVVIMVAMVMMVNADSSRSIFGMSH